MDSIAVRAATWVFGEDGDVAVEAESQVMTITSAMLTTGVVMVSPILSTLAGAYGVSEARLGLFIAAFTAPPLVVIPLAGALADRVGRKQVLLPGLLLFGLCGAAIGATTDFRVALALRALQGVGFGAAMPLTVTVLGDLYSDNREVTAQGLRQAGNYTFNVLAPAAAGVLVAVSWRTPFVLYLSALPIALWAWVALPDIEPTEGGSSRGYVTDLFLLLRQPIMALLLLSFTMRFALFYGYLTYVSTLATDSIGLSAATVGVAISVKGVLSAASSTQIGRLTATLDPDLTAVVGFAFAGAGVALPGVVPTLVALLAGAVLLGIGDAVMGTVQKSLVTQYAPLELRGGAVSASSLFQSVGKAGSPILLGAFLTVAGVEAAFVALGVAGGGLGMAVLAGVWLLRE